MFLGTAGKDANVLAVVKSGIQNTIGMAAYVQYAVKCVTRITIGKELIVSHAVMIIFVGKIQKTFVGASPVFSIIPVRGCLQILKRIACKNAGTVEKLKKLSISWLQLKTNVIRNVQVADSKVFLFIPGTGVPVPCVANSVMKSTSGT